MNPKSFIAAVNRYAAEQRPFLFVIDFEQNAPFVCPLDEAAQHQIYYDIKGCKNTFPASRISPKMPQWHVRPYGKAKYTSAFNYVHQHLARGNSYLLNLTFPSSVDTNCSLLDVFIHAKAPYKLLFKDDFTIFSPECFVRIAENKIYSYPMKGTIRAEIPHAEELLLNDKKEQWEHNTIVDLIRNDLSIVAEQVKVLRYRYVDRVETQQGTILQTSSEICGELASTWRHCLGELLWKLLPAGSVSGAPKQKTVEIIQEAEIGSRGYYCGIFGVYDGEMLDSAVNIRFLENTENGLQYRSGGGITFMSRCEEEYQELIHKIYVPSF